MTDKIVVFCTCSSPAEAEKIARLLIERRLAACVNILPGVRSLYRWKGAVEESGELLEQVRAAIEKAHSYEAPEVIALTVIDGSQAYLAWLEHELKSEDL
jgi:periplasmic divalent cation tolerance protein